MFTLNVPAVLFWYCCYVRACRHAPRIIYLRWS